MRSNSDVNGRSAKRIHYPRGRRFTRFMSHLITVMFVLWGLWMLWHTYQDPSFAPMLIVFIPVAVYSTTYYYALNNTCVITSEMGIEYKLPEFSLTAPWSQVKALKRNVVLPMLGLRYYLILDAPAILYTKGFGTAYKLQLNHILFPGWQKRIPLGKMWQDYQELENQIRTHVPSLPFDAPGGKVAG